MKKADDIFRRLSPKSLELLNAVNPSFSRIETIEANSVVDAVSRVDAELMVLFQDLSLPVKSRKKVRVRNWLVDAYHEAFVSNAESVDAYHLILAFLLHVDSEAYYKAKKAFPTEYRFTETTGLKPYYEEFSVQYQTIPHVFLGREKEITRLMVNLTSAIARPTLLVGDQGSGKTTLMHELARRIYLKKVPPVLLGATIIRVKYAAIVSIIPTDANMPVHAIFSHLLNSIAQLYARKTEKVILFIDDIRFQGNQVLGFEAFGPAAKNVLLVGACEGDFDSQVWENPVFRMWDTIGLDPLAESTYEHILHQHAKHDPSLEHVSFSETALKKIVELHKSDLSLDAMPGGGVKTLELLAVYKQFLGFQPDSTKKGVMHRKGSAKGKTLSKSATAKASASTRRRRVSVVERDVEEFFFGQHDKKRSEIALEGSKLMKFEQELKRVVVGQDEAIEALAKSLRVSSMKLSSHARPVGNFLFLGPTGVGKTYTAKQLAAVLYGYRDPKKLHPARFIRIDMTEFTEKHAVSKLFGAPPGYVGYDDASSLVDFVAENPQCVILFDEIDKAHPEVLNTLLHVMDEGEIRANNGASVSFEETIIVMTSNHGAQLIRKEQLGFTQKTVTRQKSYEDIKKILLANLKKVLKPEFLNRFDDIVVFHDLGEVELSEILALMIKQVQEAMRVRNMAFHVTPAAKKQLVAQALDKNAAEYGARELRRLWNKDVIDSVSQHILSSRKKLTAVRVDVLRGTIVIQPS